MPEQSVVTSLLATKVSSGHFPVLRQTVSQLIALLSQTEISTRSTRSIVKTISEDQGMMARVLKVANSSYYRWISGKITDVHAAVARIGYMPLRDIVITADLTEFIQKRLPAGVNLSRVLAKALVAAHQATAFGQALRLPQMESLYASALLESLGELALTTYLPEVAHEVQARINNGMHRKEAYREVAGVEPHDLTLLVAKQYVLPEDLIQPPPQWETAKNWTITEIRQGLVHVANAFAENLFAPESPERDAEFTELLGLTRATLCLEENAIVPLLRDAYATAVSLGVILDLHTTAFAWQSPSLPGARAECIRQATDLVRPKASA